MARTPKRIPTDEPHATARRTNGTLTNGLSEVLRTLGGILGDAHADEAQPEVLSHIEQAMTHLVGARKATRISE